jgi:hypothetical protein
MGNVGEMIGMSGITPNIIFGTDVMPEKELKNASMAFRADFDYSALGGAVSFFRGYDPYHGIEINNFNLMTSPPEFTIVSAPYKKSTIGIDFAIPIKSVIIRGEAAYNITENDEKKAYIPNPNISYVAGLEANVGGFMILVQYVGKYTFDFEKLVEPVLRDTTMFSLLIFANEMINYQFNNFNRKIFNQQEKLNNAVSVTASKSFFYDQLNAELTGYYNFTSEETMIRPCISWKINDIVSLTAGGIYMHGKENSLYSFSSKTMNGAFVELKASF